MKDSDNATHRKKPAIRFLAFGLSSFAIAAGLIVLLSAIVMNSAPVPEEHLRQLTDGMSKDEVIAIIGPPQIEYEGGRTWQYGRRWMWSHVVIYFDEEDRLIRWHLDR